MDPESHNGGLPFLKTTDVVFYIVYVKPVIHTKFEDMTFFSDYT